MFRVLAEIREGKDLPKAMSEIRQAMQEPNKKEGDVIMIIVFNRDGDEIESNEIESSVAKLFEVDKK